jgi:opacity protein-like surface antigen
MRSVRSLLVAAAATLLSTAAMAADLPQIAPPAYPQQYMPAPVEDFGGWYLRGDVGVISMRATRISNPLDSTLNAIGPTYPGTAFSGASSFGIGVGYQVNSWIRGDITAEWRNAAVLRGSVIGSFFNRGVPVASVDNYSADVSSALFLLNGYVDLGTWWCITPFVGAGVGTAYHRVTSFRDDGLNFAGGFANPSVFFGADANKMDLAWAVHAGLGYKVNQNLTIELAYRYVNMGSAVTAAGGFPFDRSFVGTHFWTVNDITSNDFRLGVRWTCCETPPPPVMPLIRKG